MNNDDRPPACLNKLSELLCDQKHTYNSGRKGCAENYSCVKLSLFSILCMIHNIYMYDVPGFHGTIGACACSGFQALVRVREGLETKLT